MTPAQNISTKSGTFPPIALAPDVALKYAREHEYRAILVKDGPGDISYSHVNFLAGDVDLPLFLSALEKSITQKSSYYSSIHK